MTTIEDKRIAISWAYAGDRWLDRVKKMKDSQVHSVYMRLKNNGRLEGVPTYSAIRDE